MYSGVEWRGKPLDHGLIIVGVKEVETDAALALNLNLNLNLNLDMDMVLIKWEDSFTLFDDPLGD